MQSGVKKPLDCRHRDVQRLAGVVLDPLAEVGVGVLMAVLVRRRQLVMNFQHGSEGRQRQEDHDHGDGNRSTGRPWSGDT